MRLVTCTLTAVLLSGCSWLGSGGHGGGYGSAGGAYGVNCAPGGQAGYGQMQQTQYSYGGGGAGCAGGGYGVAGGGFGPGGYGAGAGGAGYGMGAGGSGYGPGAGMGLRGPMGGGAGYGIGGAGYGAAAGGAGGYGMGGAGYGAGAGGAGYGMGAGGYGMTGAGGYGGAYGGGVTTLGGAAPYGSALGGAYGSNVVGTQMVNGQWVDGAAVQTVQGAPIYVPQPYPAYYQAGGSGYNYAYGQSSGGGAMPFGLELGGGTEFGIGGNIFTDKDSGPADGDTATGLQVGAIDGISYGDAFGHAKNIGGTLAYDANRNTTLFGTLGYSNASGQVVDDYTTVTAGAYDAAGVFTAGAGETPRSLNAEFSDLERLTVEGGVRQYVGYNPVFRPYVGASAGFVHNNNVDFTQTYADDGSLYDEQQYISSGWNPTAAAVIGAEMAVGQRAAIGVESGVRWRDNMDTNLESEDSWSIPVSLRGRVAF